MIKGDSGLNIIVKNFEEYLGNYDEHEEDDEECEEYFVIIEYLHRLKIEEYLKRIERYIDVII